MLRILGYICIILSGILFFVVPVSIEWGFVDPKYLDGLLFLLLGLVCHGTVFLFLSEFKQ